MAKKISDLVKELNEYIAENGDGEILRYEIIDQYAGHKYTKLNPVTKKPMTIRDFLKTFQLKIEDFCDDKRK